MPVLTSESSERMMYRAQRPGLLPWARCSPCARSAAAAGLGKKLWVDSSRGVGGADLNIPGQVGNVGL
jgi:hypothetical protein